jgi:hypothetical protein
MDQNQVAGMHKGQVSLSSQKKERKIQVAGVHKGQVSLTPSLQTKEEKEKKKTPSGKKERRCSLISFSSGKAVL